MKASSGAFAWFGLAAFVAVYDTWAIARDGVTLSTAFRSSARHPSWRWVVGPIWVITTLHLFGVLPRYGDPFNLWAFALNKLAGAGQ